MSKRKRSPPAMVPLGVFNPRCLHCHIVRALAEYDRQTGSLEFTEALSGLESVVAEIIVVALPDPKERASILAQFSAHIVKRIVEEDETVPDGTILQ